MIKLKNIVLQMKEEDFQNLSSQLVKTKADKFHTLLIHYRNNDLTEEEIAEKICVNNNTYYTLKSRLYNKIQELLTPDSEGSKFNLLQSVANIPNLLFNSPRDIALAILAKLEKDLIEFDLPYELTNVYNALKKLHINSPKYYEYSQLYNKHVAYTLALDKAEDLLANFHKTYGEYSLSKDKNLLELLCLIKKEMTNLCLLYQSHHLSVYQNILDISFALFVPYSKAIEDDLPVEDILSKTDSILTSYPKDITYQHLKIVFDFLSFEYYHKLKQYKKATTFFERVNEVLPSFLLNNFCCFNSAFLISKAERHIINGTHELLYEENMLLASKYDPDKTDIPNYINYVKVLAAGAFNTQRYSEVILLINSLLNEITLKTIPHAEVELKLFLALSYSLTSKYENAQTVLRSVSRKIRDINKDCEYDNSITFIKLINLAIDPSSRENDEKIYLLRNKFFQLNEGIYRILNYLDLNDEFISYFLNVTKTKLTQVQPE